MKKGSVFLMLLFLLLLPSISLLAVKDKPTPSDKNETDFPSLPAKKGATLGAPKNSQKPKNASPSVEKTETPPIPQLASTAPEATTQEKSDESSDSAPSEEPKDNEESNTTEDQTEELEESEKSEEDKWYSDFEDQAPQAATPTQVKHNKVWKIFNNPGAPQNLIKILQQTKEIKPEELCQYQRYVETAITDLADQFSFNHKRRTAKEGGIALKQDICLTNKIYTEHLVAIMQLAQDFNISIDPKIEGMAAYWVEQNKTALVEYKNAAEREANTFALVQNEDALNKLFKLSTLQGRIKRLRWIKPERFASGTKKAKNIEATIEIASKLQESIQINGLVLDDLEEFVALCADRKIPLDYDSLASLHETLVEKQTRNNELFAEQKSRTLALDTRAEKISNSLKNLMGQYEAAKSADLPEKETGLIDFVRQFKTSEESETE